MRGTSSGQIFKFLLGKDRDPQYLRFIQLASGLFPHDQIAGPFAHRGRGPGSQLQQPDLDLVTGVVFQSNMALS